MIDFVEWCDFVLKKLLEASRKTSTARGIGVQDRFLAQYLFSEDAANQQGFQESTTHRAMINALSQLQQIGLVEKSPFWKITRAGREHAADMLSLWQSICQEKIEAEHQQMLQVIDRLSPHTAYDHVWLEEVTYKTLVSELEWSDDSDLLWSVAQDLDQWRFVGGHFFMGDMKLWATYRGLVWETRRGFTLESRFIDDLVAEWETRHVGPA